MKGYKAFEKDLTCRGFQYEIGKTYEMDGYIEPCDRGFHFCKSIGDCYKFYPMSNSTRICEVDAIGEVKTDDDIKFCTNKITIIEEVAEDWQRKGNANVSSTGYCNSGDFNSGDRNSGDFNSGNCNSGNCNSGDCNSGDRNSGDCNSGYCNSGDRNSGNRNSGNRNSGDFNSGNRNSGYFNSGNRNSGDRNSGDCNSGYWNSGNWNSTNFSSGCFCTEEPEMLLFDKPSGMTFKDFRYSYAYNILLRCPFGLYEKDGNLVEHTAKEREDWWDNLSNYDRKAITDLPNFDMDKFRKCMQMEEKR